MFRASGIEIKTDEQIGLMRRAGLLVGETLQLLRESTRPGITTGELDAIAEENIRRNDGIPSFKGYHGFPGSICTSVNEEVVHGIPSKDRLLREGDLLSIDCGAIVEGWHGDAAISVSVGASKADDLALATACEDAMWAGLARALVGARLSDISHRIEESVLASGSFGIVRGYGGHGIGTEMHMDPHVLNYGRPGRGPKLRAGMALAIEPMVTAGSPETRELSDGWTVVTQDKSRAAHTEHTVAILEDGPWVLTALDGGVSRLGAAISARQKR